VITPRVRYRLAGKCEELQSKEETAIPKGRLAKERPSRKTSKERQLNQDLFVQRFPRRELAALDPILASDQDQRFPSSLSRIHPKNRSPRAQEPATQRILIDSSINYPAAKAHPKIHQIELDSSKSDLTRWRHHQVDQTRQEALAAAWERPLQIPT
jgi:Ulp1 family protease